MSAPHLRVVEASPKRPGPVDVKRWIGALAGDQDLWLTVRLVGVYIASLYNPTKGYAWPSYPEIADHLGMQRRDVRRAVDILEDSGWLTVTRKRGKGQRNEYVPAFDKGAPTRPYDEPLRAHTAHRKGRTERTVKGAPTRARVSTPNQRKESTSARRRTGEPQAIPDPVPRAPTQEEGAAPPPPPPAAPADVDPDAALRAGRSGARRAQRSTKKPTSQPTLEQEIERWRGKIPDVDLDDLAADVRKRADKNPAAYLHKCCENELRSFRKHQAQGLIQCLEDRWCVRPTDIAKAVGVAPSAVSTWKARKRAPTIEQLAKLKALDAEHEAKAEAAEEERRAKAEREAQERNVRLERQERERQERQQRKREQAEIDAPAAIERYRNALSEAEVLPEAKDYIDDLIDLAGKVTAAKIMTEQCLPPRLAVPLLKAAVVEQRRARANGTDKPAPRYDVIGT